MNAEDGVRDPHEQARWLSAAVARTVGEAAARSPAFGRRLAAAGLSADTIEDAAALDRLPVLTKDELREQQRQEPPFGGYLADGAAVPRVFQSPGPLYEPQREGPDPWRWAPALEAAGFGADDLVLNTFGYHLSPAGVMFDAAAQALGATVLPAGVGSKQAQVEACADLGVTAYVGTPSYLRALLDTAAESGHELTIARAFVTAEPLPATLRASLATDVGTVRQGFGTAETGLLGFECEQEQGLHVPDDALVQIVDLTTGEARHDDGQGQVVVTLFDPTYPIVRFGTGDLSSWLREPCPCGRPSPRIAGWQGRVGDAVKVRGMFLHPAQVAAALAGVAEVDRYRVSVDRVDHVDVVHCEVVPAADDGADLASVVADRLRDRLRLRVEVSVVESLDEAVPAFEDLRRWD